MENIKAHNQKTPWDSPWTMRERIGQVLWGVAWALLCVWTPKPLNPWRLLVARVFGVKIEGYPFIHQRARIQVPRNLTLRHRACIGDRANAYSLGPIEICEAATIAQEAYLCSGTHNFADPRLPLVTAPIKIGKKAFVGARAFIMPGVTVGDEAVVGACSVVTNDVPPAMVCAGNPAKIIRGRYE